MDAYCGGRAASRSFPLLGERRQHVIFENASSVRDHHFPPSPPPFFPAHQTPGILCSCLT